MYQKSMFCAKVRKISKFFITDHFYNLLKPGAIVRSVAMSLGNLEARQSILASGTSFREDLVMKLFLRPFFSSADSRRAVVS